MTRTSTLLALATLCLSCREPLPSVVDAEDFELDARYFNWEAGATEQISIGADGASSYVFLRSRIEQWPLEQANAQGETTQDVLAPALFQITWTTPPEQLRELQELLDDGRFLGLGDSYQDRGVSDGAMNTYTLRARGETKTVRCINDFPRTIRRLDALLDELHPDVGVGTITEDRPLPPGARELDDAELDAMGLR